MVDTLTREDDDDLTARRRSARRVALVAGTIGLIAVLVWMFVFSSVLGAKRVVVHGAHTVPVSRIESVADVPHGRPLLRLDTGAIAGRVEQLPDIAAASVHVSYPSTVVITVTERVAVGYLSVGGTAILVDKSGRQFRTTSTVPKTLPRFDIPAGQQATAAGQAVATVAGALTPAELGKLSSIAATDPTHITLRLRDGRSVIWGSADRSADKAQVLPALLTRPGTTFDVSNPDVVVAR
ncbi:MAG TPA: FtsQ-type POTRA domain-containing protein [Jatrophihabitantaceae bacterium]|jgi:cell division protein FtsQ